MFLEGEAERRVDEQQFDHQGRDDEWDWWLSEDGTYQVDPSGTSRNRFEGDQLRTTKLANFAARVVEETVLDDGEASVRYYTVEGRMSTGRRLGRQRVPVTKFSGMNWPQEVWGFGPSIVASHGSRDHLRAAIEAFSADGVARRTIYTAIGWHKTESGWAYTHAGGAVGSTGVDVTLEPDLQGYHLPPLEKSGSATLRQALLASLSFLELGDPRIVFPIWAAVFRAPLCHSLPVNFVLWCLGESGAFKTTLSALALNHYGAGFDKDFLSASWLDTYNRLQHRAFLVKDALLVVDDFCPERNAGASNELDRKASQFIRSIGNNQGRGRLTAESTAQRTYRPRGVVLSTAEQLPGVAPSALARIFPVTFEKGAIDTDRLTQLQREAHLLPQVLASYVDYLRVHLPDMKECLKERFIEHRNRARVEGHSRLPEVVAHLYLGLEAALRFFNWAGVLPASRCSELCDLGWSTFMALASQHGKTLVEERPSVVFLNTLAEGLASGRAWLANRSTGEVQVGNNTAGSAKLGWTDNDGVYLLWDSALEFASQRLQHRGGLTLKSGALKSMLLNDGVLIRGGEPNRLETKTRCEQNNIRVVVLRRDALRDGTMHYS